jgi:hypothetical protein
VQLDEIGVIDAIIQKVQTTADGGMRITLDSGMDSVEIFKKLIHNKMYNNGQVKVVFIQENQDGVYNP